MIDVPGIYQIGAAEYHRDSVGPAPSLSASIAHILLNQSAWHAWFAHPRLNPAYERQDDERFDLGTAAHAYLLEGESGFTIIQAPDWRTKLAKEARDDARRDGKIPLLADRWGDVQGMALAAGQQLDVNEDPPRPLANGRPEQTLVWQEDGAWCRARLDWLHDDRKTIDDLKTTGASANPDVWTRALFGAGHDVQAAFYLRGLKALTGITAAFRFVVQETFPPYALSVIGLAPEALEIGARKVEYAIRLWRHCLALGEFPGYPTRVCYADPPPWESARWLEIETRARFTDDDRPLADQLMGESDAGARAH